MSEWQTPDAPTSTITSPGRGGLDVDAGDGQRLAGGLEHGGDGHRALTFPAGRRGWPGVIRSTSIAIWLLILYSLATRLALRHSQGQRPRPLEDRWSSRSPATRSATRGSRPSGCTGPSGGTPGRAGCTPSTGGSAGGSTDDPAVRVIVLTGSGHTFCHRCRSQGPQRVRRGRALRPGAAAGRRAAGLRCRPEFDADMAWQLGMRTPMIAAVNGALRGHRGRAGRILRPAVRGDRREDHHRGAPAGTARRVRAVMDPAAAVGMTHTADILLTGGCCWPRKWRLWGSSTRSCRGKSSRKRLTPTPGPSRPRPRSRDDGRKRQMWAERACTATPARRWRRARPRSGSSWPSRTTRRGWPRCSEAPAPVRPLEAARRNVRRGVHEGSRGPAALPGAQPVRRRGARLFDIDEEGFASALGDGTVPPDQRDLAAGRGQLPEQAISLDARCLIKPVPAEGRWGGRSWPGTAAGIPA